MMARLWINLIFFQCGKFQVHYITCCAKNTPLLNQVSCQSVYMTKVPNISTLRWFRFINGWCALNWCHPCLTQVPLIRSNDILENVHCVGKSEISTIQGIIWGKTDQLISWLSEKAFQGEGDTICLPAHLEESICR